VQYRATLLPGQKVNIVVVVVVDVDVSLYCNVFFHSLRFLCIGTGYGFDANASAWDVNAYLAAQAAQDLEIQAIVNTCFYNVSNVLSSLLCMHVCMYVCMYVVVVVVCVE
jgi:hypothetical protein